MQWNLNKVKYTHIIWDFNGTIADDVTCGIEAVNRMLAVRGMPILASREEYQSKFRFPIEAYYQELGFDFVKEPYADLAEEWVTLYRAQIPQIQMCLGAAQTISAIARAYPKLRQVILSSSETAMMEYQLAQFGIRQYFQEVIGLDNIYAGGKGTLVQAWNMREPHGRILFVGDTVHDYEVSLLADDADCVLYTQGHGSREALSACGVPLIENLPTLLRLLA